MKKQKWRPNLSPDARRRFIEANPGYRAKARLDDLEHALGVALLHGTYGSAPRKQRRAQLRAIARFATQLDAALAPNVLVPLALDDLRDALGGAPGTLEYFEHLLSRVSRGAAAKASSIPTRAGRPRATLRDLLVSVTSTWVESLEPIDAAGRGSLRRGERLVSVPLLQQTKADFLRRRKASIAIMLDVLDQPAGAESLLNTRRILRKSREHKSTA